MMVLAVVLTLFALLAVVAFAMLTGWASRELDDGARSIERGIVELDDELAALDLEADIIEGREVYPPKRVRLSNVLGRPLNRHERRALEARKRKRARAAEKRLLV